MPDPSRRPTQRRPGGRGRADTPAARTASRPSQRSSSSGRNSEATRPKAAHATAEQPRTPGGATLVPRLRSGLRVTQRAIILGVVLVVLLFSYATTLRVFFNQQYRIAEAREQIAQHEQSISTLEDEIERWNDPQYVKIQARERLGWVVPGETGFRVIGPDGKPYGGGSQIGAAQLPEGEYAKTWWDRMWGSVTAADDPIPQEDGP
ncbi:MAG: septum formation initiator family protein [Brooklawnia sp.]